MAGTGRQLRKADARLPVAAENEGVWVYRDARFELATDSFVEGVWRLYGVEIIDALSASQSAYQVRLPIVGAEGLAMGSGAAPKVASASFRLPSRDTGSSWRSTRQRAQRRSDLESIAGGG